MTDNTGLSRRVFLSRAGGLTLVLGAGGLLGARARGAAPRSPYAGGVWLAGDHHIHTKYSPDGQYEIGRQVANAGRYGLSWCVITDHGGPHHDRVALEQAYPELLEARRRNPNLTVFQGMEWNIPSAEHGSIIVPIGSEEAQRVSEFERLFDEKNQSKAGAHNRSEADAVEAVQYLESLNPRPLFMANHPARRGLDSPHEMRAWAEAGPHVAHGFEGAPGHQGSTLVGGARGEYDNVPGPKSFAGYPAEAYRTWGGYDWYVAQVGGLWDSLLGEGREWFITANSDSHRHYDDHAALDTSTYLTKGFVTDTGKTAEKGTEPDFYPGEYSKTWVFARTNGSEDILNSLRSGSMFTTLGDLVDRVEFWAAADGSAARMGGTLALSGPGETVDIVARVRVPDRPNFGGRSRELHHIDVIAGDILGPAADRDAFRNPSTQVIAQIPAAEARREGPLLTFRWRMREVRGDQYVRIRGTNTDVSAPRMDRLGVDPWSDLWFYSNPIFLRLPKGA